MPDNVPINFTQPLPSAGVSPSPLSAMGRQSWRPDGGRGAQNLAARIQSRAADMTPIPGRAAAWHEQLSARLSARGVAASSRPNAGTLTAKATAGHVHALAETNGGLLPVTPETGFDLPFLSRSSAQNVSVETNAAAPFFAAEPRAHSAVVFPIRASEREEAGDPQSPSIITAAQSIPSVKAAYAQTGAAPRLPGLPSANTHSQSPNITVKGTSSAAEEAVSPTPFRLSRPPLQLAIMGDAPPAAPDSANAGAQGEASSATLRLPSRLNLNITPRAPGQRAASARAPVVFPLPITAVGVNGVDTKPTASATIAATSSSMSSLALTAASANVAIQPPFGQRLREDEKHVAPDAAHSSGPTFPVFPMISAKPAASDADWTQAVAWHEGGSAFHSEPVADTVYVSNPASPAAYPDDAEMRNLVARLIREQGFPDPFAALETLNPAPVEPASASGVSASAPASASATRQETWGGSALPPALNIHDLTAKVTDRVADRLDAARRRSNRLERERKGLY